MARRRRSPVSRLLGNLSDDAKGLVDDLTTRARAVEGQARDAVRHAVDDDGSEADADRREVEELSAALAELTKKVNRLAEGQGGPGRVGARGGGRVSTKKRCHSRRRVPARPAARAGRRVVRPRRAPRRVDLRAAGGRARGGASAPRTVKAVGLHLRRARPVVTGGTAGLQGGEPPRTRCRVCCAEPCATRWTGPSRTWTRPADPGETAARPEPGAGGPRSAETRRAAGRAEGRTACPNHSPRTTRSRFASTRP